MFEIGAKVVCVNGSFPTNARLHAYYRNFPKKGETYTVRDIIPAQGYRGEETCAVLLAEITNPSDDPKGRGEHGFACERFREVEKTETAKHAAASKYVRKELWEYSANGKRVINDRSEAAPGSYVVEVEWI